MAAHPRPGETWAARLAAPAPPAQPTKFEIVVRQLRLENDPQAWPISNSLRLWVKKNRNYRYVPEELLAAYGMHVLTED